VIFSHLSIPSPALIAAWRKLLLLLANLLAQRRARGLDVVCAHAVQVRLMDERDQLAVVDRQMRETEAIVDRQLRYIASLKAKGRSTASAETTLGFFVRSLRALKGRRQKMLGTLQSQHPTTGDRE
jgi:hypothetical protein